jgi:hypothetical protein
MTAHSPSLTHRSLVFESSQQQPSRKQQQQGDSSTQTSHLRPELSNSLHVHSRLRGSSRAGLSWFAIAVLLLTNAAARGQNVIPGLFCNAGLHPDGYLDLSHLPPAPTGNSMSVTPAVTANLPVEGVPGLTATITIPSLSQINPGAPAYTVDGVRLVLNGLNADRSQPTVLTLNFSAPIQGISLDVGNPTGRFAYSYSLQVGDGVNPPVYSNTASGYTYYIYTPRSQNLQAVALINTIQSASVQFQGGREEAFGQPIFSNIRVQSVSAPDPSDAISKKGLQMWLRSDKGVTVSSSGITWEDQSGNGHDATSTPGHMPTFTADGRTCQGAWLFDGASSFDFNLPIEGWREMTVFLVARSTKDPPNNYTSFSSAILWTEDAYWGNTFVSPYQSHVYARFGTTETNTNLTYIRPGAGIGGDFTITRAEHNNQTDRLYVNGIRVLSRRGNLPVLAGVTGAGTIGEGINGSYYDGEISEILVYDRVLSAQEAAQVESYLRNKYGTE